jgi:hypothetical protein
MGVVSGLSLVLRTKTASSFAVAIMGGDGAGHREGEGRGSSGDNGSNLHGLSPSATRKLPLCKGASWDGSGSARYGGDQVGLVSLRDSTALKVISMSCSGKASLVTPIRLLAH